MEFEVPRRDTWVDYAKGICIILMVYGHVARGLYSSGIWADHNLFMAMDTAIYSFHMPLLFLLSGYYFFKSIDRRGAIGYVASKIDTLVYPYVIWSLIQGGIEVLLSRYTNGSINVISVISLLWAPRAQFWFLYGLFFVSVTSAALYRFRLMRRHPWHLAAACFLALHIASYVGPVKALQYVSGYGIFFCVGAYLSAGLRFTASSATTVATIGACLVAAAVLGFDPAVRMVVALSASAVVIILSRNLTEKHAALIGKVGRCSMDIYLIHILTGSGARIVLQKVFNVNNLAIHIVVGVVAAIAGSMAVRRALRSMNAEFLFSPPSWLRTESWAINRRLWKAGRA